MDVVECGTYMFFPSTPLQDHEEILYLLGAETWHNLFVDTVLTLFPTAYPLPLKKIMKHSFSTNVRHSVKFQ